jgi:hypothetical protein
MIHLEMILQDFADDRICDATAIQMIQSLRNKGTGIPPEIFDFALARFGF